MKKIIFTSLVLGLVFNFASAQGADRAQVDSRVPENRQEMIQTRVEAQVQTRTQAEELRNREMTVEKAFQLREEFSQRLDSRPEQTRQVVEEKRERVSEIVSERQTELMQRREAMLENAQARRVQLQDARLERVEKRINNAFSQLTLVTEKLANIATRIDSRITSLEEQGVDVTSGREALDNAITSIENVLTEIEIVKAELSEALSNEVSAEYIRDLVSGIKNSILESRQLLRLAIVEISN